MKKKARRRSKKEKRNRYMREYMRKYSQTKKRRAWLKKYYAENFKSLGMHPLGRWSNDRKKSK